MNLMNLMGLDTSKSCGWALSRDWGHPLFGVKEFPRGNNVEPGRVFNLYEQWLRDMIALHQIDLVLYEAPVQGVDNMETAFILIGMAAYTDGICNDLGVRVYREESSTIRKHFIGYGRTRKGRNIKDDVGFKCRQLGWKVSDHNAQDALATLAYARDTFLPAGESQMLGGVRG